ncbi:MAG: hypothetical protein LBI67_01845 [Treponema sp.]|jgi:hypothetical protein|nr:hypothetical protein [Treponema sp.]
MKFSAKVITTLFLAAALAVSASAQTNTDIKKFENAITDVSQVLGKAMITNSAFGLNWSDAYIGQLIGSPPHFGIGASGGFTAIPGNKLDPIFKEFNDKGFDSLDLPVNFMPLPALAAELRLGGFLLPFDIGIKALPVPEQTFEDFKIKYTMVGGDIRYALMKESGRKPNISVGVGLTYTNADLSAALSGGADIDLTDLGYSGDTLEIRNPQLNFSMQNTTLDLKVQVSKRFFIVTPYVGLGVSYGWSSIDLGANTTITVNGSAVPSTVINSMMDEYGISLSGTGLSKSGKYSGFGLRGFGGLSLNISVVKIDITGLYDVVNQNWGAGFGLRVQI